MNCLISVVCIVLFHSLFIGYLSCEDTGYPCFPADQCQNETNATFASAAGESFCCKGGDAINVTVTGNNFHYQSSSFFYRSLTKRDADNSSSVAESKNNLTTTCTCKPVDREALREEFLKSLEESRKKMKEFFSKFPW
ncbi:hypothetical protein Btru_027425 [Bulinus truncatus]|nr:hypothetical protein Btru_027425 [Bulinus truncatus]